MKMNMKKRITFLLPGIANRPIGGYKVVYEYANRLVGDGYIVNIVYPTYLHFDSDTCFFRFLRISKAFVKYIYYILTKKYICNKWFDLNKCVNEFLVPSLSEKWCPKSDVCVATSARTAIYMNRYKESVSKIYLIQGYEAWNGITDEQLIDTYKYQFKKIVISKWLYDIVSKYDPDCQLIPNGFDFDFFKKTVECEKRDRYTLAMMYHVQELKGCDDGFMALDIVKKRCPQLKVSLFSVYPEPDNLPDWITYYRQPDKDTFNKIYNSTAIFVGTSWSEGWGLTIGEAMMCGCAVACTDNAGYREMAIDNNTALLSPIKNPAALAENIIRLIEDDALRIRIAEQGYEYIQRFKWDDSYCKLKSILN
ncbi:MAG: glycosyltransferase family 4 protein [Bacteroidales bacterium]|nr:glycosyltransferase family 4 protein [Bacteroidales bacterium]